MSVPIPPSLYLELSRAVKGNDLFTVRGLLRSRSDWSEIEADWLFQLPYDAGHWEMFDLLLTAGFGRSKGRLSGKLLKSVCYADASEEVILARVNDLLARGVDAGSPNPALNVAALRGHISVVERLLDAGADPEDLAHDGFPALQNVAWKSRRPGVTDAERLAIAELLLKRGANPNGGQTNERKPIRQASASGDLPMVRLLLQRGADPNVYSSWKGTPLHEAVQRYPGDIMGMVKADIADITEIMRLLLAAGANPNALDSERKTPLHNALHAKAIPEVVDLLLAHGADPLITTAKNESAIDYTLKVGNPSITAAILAHLPPGFSVGGRSDAYIEAAAHGDDADGLQHLRRFGLVISKKYSHGRMSPFHTAARFGATKVLKMCLAAGSLPDVCDRLGRTPLHMAARYNRPDAIEILLRFGADANLADKSSKTPLAIAQEMNKKRAIAALTNPAKVLL